ncbi:MAG: hypothetical protein JST39_04000 [Bacteroidetes bacterium]|nr:hypothetical protein [Bacteroidota bacterium]
MKQGILVAVLVTAMVVFICQLVSKYAPIHRSHAPASKDSRIADDGPGGFPAGTGLLIHELFY